MKFDFNSIQDVELDGINTADYPDFCDAFIASAIIQDHDGTLRDATEAELDIINDDSDYVYQCVIDRLF